MPKMYSDLFSSLDGNYSLKIWLLPPVFLLFFSYPQSFNLSLEGNLNQPLSALWSVAYPLNLTKALLSKVMFAFIILNLTGLLPYVYGLTTNIWWNSSLALLIWGGAIMSGFMYKPLSAIAHLVPAGSPAPLIPFLVLIETISILIRPLTLTVRLVANISAGHIVMTLIANLLSMLTLDHIFILTFAASLFYILFEMFVSLIQAYIFTLLISLYIKEHPST